MVFTSTYTIIFYPVSHFETANGSFMGPTTFKSLNISKREIKKKERVKLTNIDSYCSWLHIVIQVGDVERVEGRRPESVEKLSGNENSVVLAQVGLIIPIALSGICAIDVTRCDIWFLGSKVNKETELFHVYFIRTTW